MTGYPVVQGYYLEGFLWMENGKLFLVLKLSIVDLWLGNGRRNMVSERTKSYGMLAVVIGWCSLPASIRSFPTSFSA